MTVKRSIGAPLGAGLLSLILNGPPVNAQGPPPAFPAAPPVTGAAPAEALPPIGNDFPLWLRPPGSAPEGLEPAGESRPEGRAEEGSEIETDRDSFTPATRTAGRGRLIVESAYSFIDNRGVKETHSYPELLLRYGVTEFAELRLGWNYEVGGAPNHISGSQVEDVIAGMGLLRESTINYGTKVRLTRQDRWIPASVVILQGYTPTSGEANDTQLVSTSAVGWVLPNRWKFDSALRFATASEGEDRFDVTAPSAVLKIPVREKWNIHGEYFGLFSRNKDQDFVRHFFSPGVHYLITPNLEVGVRVGWGLNDQSARFFSNAGVGWQF
jgi:hypothetical protein